MTSRAEQDVLLFSILLKCLASQSETLEYQFVGEAKMRTNNLINCARTTFKTYFKDLPTGAEDALDQLHDFIYMLVRDASNYSPTSILNQLT